MRTLFRLLNTLISILLTLLVVSLISLLSIYLYLLPTFPTAEELHKIQLQQPFSVFSRDNKLMSQFSTRYRIPLEYHQIPPVFIQAIQAVEDQHFNQHFGIDLFALTRAAYQMISGQRGTGGSTITMQVAKNYFLTPERTLHRKFKEILLALHIERLLTKKEIMELYVNKIYLGKRAYGIAAAAQVYYGKQISELNLSEIAMIAGLPRAPSSHNPIKNPERARQRRNYVLSRMLKLNLINAVEYAEAAEAPLTAGIHRTMTVELKDAQHAAHMVFEYMQKHYPDSLYKGGYRIYTSIDSQLQTAANKALRRGLIEHSIKKMPWQPPEVVIQINTEHTSDQRFDHAAAIDYLNEQRTALKLQPALLIERTAEQLIFLTTAGKVILSWRAIPSKHPLKQFLAQQISTTDPDEEDAKEIKMSLALPLGALYWLSSNGKKYHLLAHQPELEGALLSVNPSSGAILALVGGSDFQKSSFNRVTQASRQIGSSIKPFLYGAALNQGMTAATLINDAPMVFKEQAAEEDWRPANSSKRFYGPTRMRQALYSSRNLVSIRLLNDIGIQTAIDFSTTLGLPHEKLTPDLTFALGTSSLTPLELTKGYMSIANGGYLVEPYLIERILDKEGHIVYQTAPPIFCDGPDTVADQQSSTSCLQPIMDKRVHYILYSMMQDVTRYGTGRRAKQLKRTDLAGKTGSTDYDAWFVGFTPKQLSTVWVGFDSNKSLGNRVYSTQLTLPIWINFMRSALKHVPTQHYPQPSGLVHVRIDPLTGEAIDQENTTGMFEIFRTEFAPIQSVEHSNLDNTVSPEQEF